MNRYDVKRVLTIVLVGAALVLNGCEETAKTPPVSAPPDTPIQEKPAPDEEEQPPAQQEQTADAFLYSEYDPPSPDSDIHTFYLYSNKTLQRSSVEETIRNSFKFTTNFNTEAPTLSFEWVDEKGLRISVNGLKRLESAYFRMDDALTADGVRFGDIMEHRLLSFKTTALPEQKTFIHAMPVSGADSKTIELPTILDYKMIELEDGQTRMLIYPDGSNYIIINPSLFISDTIPFLSSLKKIERRADFNYFKEFASDRWKRGSFYVVTMTQSVYRYDWEEGTGKKIYDSDKPIYGIAVSPDRSRIALLVSVETIAVTYADLIIINEKGEVLMKKENVSHISHSDGFYSFYPIRWLDNHTVSVDSEPLEDTKTDFGYVEHRIDAASGESAITLLPTAQWNEAGSAIILSAEGIEAPVTPEWRKMMTPDETFPPVPPIKYHISPDSDHIAFSVNRSLFLYNRSTQAMKWIGIGHFAGWTESGAILWLQGYSPFVFI